MTSLPFRIAFRYLFARKSYNVINTISAIGVTGMAIGTAALVMILSVFNGFDSLVSQSLTDAHPDLVVKPVSGKVFTPEGFDRALASEDVLRLSSILEEQVFISYDNKQSLARVKGMDPVSEEESPMRRHLIDGVWQLHRGKQPSAVVGAGLAASLGMNPRLPDQPVRLPSLADTAAFRRFLRERRNGCQTGGGSHRNPSGTAGLSH